MNVRYPQVAVERIANWLVWSSSRRLPLDVRADYCNEWSAEVSAILDDPGTRFAWRRELAALWFAVDQFRGVRQIKSEARGEIDHKPEDMPEFIGTVIIHDPDPKYFPSAAAAEVNPPIRRSTNPMAEPWDGVNLP
ncbi:hypothetical protein [Spirillospora sp. CA-294931]|uniref:hypothetical protein n=1 Tax=Spirillospora sp. CA-294931 TaxID=3240042 RepID=UPI003D8E7410